jgi:NAD(P)-dependent dehydrogenase (short-subunit alcohol dehydrogenase family)
LSADARRRVAIIAGAASGVGLATVEGVLADGFFVVAIDRAACPAALDDRDGLRWVTGDVTADATWNEAVQHARSIDAAGARCLISCAGDAVFTPFLQTPLDDYRRLFEINALGTLRGMLAVIPDMVARRAGAIAVVCSVDSLYTEEGMSAYSASKAALLQIVRSAALEHAGAGLRINAVCPGAIDTPLLRRALESSDDPDLTLREHVKRIPVGQILRPDEVASVLRFLVSDGASGLSGAALTVDGGLTSTYEFSGGGAS